jgi:hypothetical protein
MKRLLQRVCIYPIQRIRGILYHIVADALNTLPNKSVEKVKLPFIEAILVSLGNMRMRFTKTVITTISITLGISFIAFLMMTSIIFRVYTQTSGVNLPIESYQYWLVSIALLVCIVSITNSMLIAVYERYREIGTMKVLGALDRHIMILFLLESAIMGFMGGILGFIVGGIGSIISGIIQVGFDPISDIQIHDWLSCFSFSISLAVCLGIFATLYPAYKAAKLNPVEALSFEL